VNVDHYKEECAYGAYAPRLKSLLSQAELPGSMATNGAVADIGTFRLNCPSFALSENRTSSSSVGPYFSQIYRDDDVPSRMTVSRISERKAPLTMQAEKKYFFGEWKNFKRAALTAKMNGFEISGFYHVERKGDYWRDVIEEQLRILDNNFNGLSTITADKQYAQQFKNKKKSASSLLLESKSLFINVVGQSKDDKDAVLRLIADLKMKTKSRLKVGFNHSVGNDEYRMSSLEKRRAFKADLELSEGEYSTLTHMHNYCRRIRAENKKAFVYYFKTLGSCCSRKGDPASPVASWREVTNTFMLEYPSICLRALLNGHPTCGIDYAHARYT
jgi:hypothetical protein